MSSITKTNKIGIFAMMFIAGALIGSVVTFGDNMAYATKNTTKQNKISNKDKQMNKTHNVYLQKSPLHHATM